MPKAGVIARRHRRKHIPTQRHHRLNPADPRECFVSRDEFSCADVILRQRKLTDDLLKPQLLGLVNDDKQHLIIKCGLRMLAVKQRIKREVTRISHLSHAGL